MIKREHLCNKHFTCRGSATIDHVIPSAYRQDSEPIGHYLQHLETTVLALQSKEFIMCIDVNAISAYWLKRPQSHSGVMDQRGNEEFNPQHWLTVHNRKGNAATFAYINGQPNIDVTIATNAIARKGREWTVHPHVINSGHNLISFAICKKLQFRLRGTKQERGICSTQKGQIGFSDTSSTAFSTKHTAT